MASGGSKKDERRAQHVVVMRHSERLDHVDPLWARRADRPWDPPVSDDGLKKAAANGTALTTGLSFAVTRVFSSPFLRCLQTAGAVVPALSRCPTPVKVSIEYGLAEVMNGQTIRGGEPEGGGRWFPEILDLEAQYLPAAYVDRNAEPLYHEIPAWGETLEEAKKRFASVIQALADKYPNDHLLLITHADAVSAAFSHFQGQRVSRVDYCGYCHLKREITLVPTVPPVAKPFKVVSRYGIVS